MRFRLLLCLLFVGMLAGCSEDKKSFDQLKEEGIAAYLTGDYLKARELLQQAKNSKGTDRDILYYLGRSYARDYIYDSALLVLKQADYLHPSDPEINQAILDAAHTSRAWVEAKDALKNLERLGEAPSDYLQRYNMYYGQIGNWPQTWFYRKKLLDADPENPLRYLELAAVQLQMDSLNQAIATLEQSIDRLGELPQLMTNLGLYYGYADENQKAEKLFRSLVAENPGNPIHLLNLANVLTVRDDPAKKREGLDIYKRIRNQVPPEIPIDSLIQVVEQELERG